MPECNLCGASKGRHGPALPMLLLYGASGRFSLAGADGTLGLQFGEHLPKEQCATAVTKVGELDQAFLGTSVLVDDADLGTPIHRVRLFGPPRCL